MQFSGDLCGGVGNWDDHAVNQHVFEAMQYRAAFFDRAVAALIDDIYGRGLEERVMVVVTGEFGRTPKINDQPSTGKRVASGGPGTLCHQHRSGRLGRCDPQRDQCRTVGRRHALGDGR